MIKLNELNFIVICADFNTGGLRNTTNSIKLECPDSSFLTVVGCNVHEKDITELSKYSSIHKGGKTITSLIDAGMEQSTQAWNFILMSGSRVRQSILRKYIHFTKSVTDILYPIIERKIPFDEASINGILIHRDTYKQIGSFGDEGEDIKIVKLFWALDALKYKCQLKGIVGAQFF